jgi:hypothetical protein
MKNSQKKSSHNPTMMIKSKFSNQIHKLLDPCYGLKRGSREYWTAIHNRQKNPLTEKQKAEIFDQIEKIHKECSTELINYFIERKNKKIINKERIERGWKPKKKTSKEEYEIMKNLEYSE